MTSDIPPKDYPIVQHVVQMVRSFMANDFVRYQRERNVLLAYVDNLDEMLKRLKPDAD